jgi:tRNA G10  N-methylase Trm11
MLDKRKDSGVPPVPIFLRRLREIASSVAELDTAFDRKPLPTVLRADACHFPICSSSIDAVVTHPPYIGSIPYAEYGVLSLQWLGYDAKKLDSELTGGRRQSSKVVERFEVAFKEMFREAHRVLKPQKCCFMLLGNPTVKGKEIDLPKMAKSLARKNGFDIVEVVKRKGINRRANLLGNESLLFFRRK